MSINLLIFLRLDIKVKTYQTGAWWSHVSLYKGRGTTNKGLLAKFVPIPQGVTWDPRRSLNQPATISVNWWIYCQSPSHNMKSMH